MKLIAIAIAFVLTSGCSPLPSKENREAYFNGAHGKVSFDVSGLGNTRFLYIFKGIEPKVNKILQSECFKTYMTETPVDVDIHQDAFGAMFSFVKDEVRNLHDVHRYIVSQTVNPYISIEKMPEGTAAQGGPGIMKFGEEVIAEGESVLIKTVIHEILHVMGFSHGKNDDPKRFTSVPYHADWAAFVCRMEGNL
jgi:hypothetical protein